MTTQHPSYPAPPSLTYFDELQKKTSGKAIQEIFTTLDTHHTPETLPIMKKKDLASVGNFSNAK
jgi:hypothetical protein